MRVWRNRWVGWATGVVIAASFVPWSRQHIAGFAIGSIILIVAVGLAEWIVQLRQRRNDVQQPLLQQLDGEVPQWGSSLSPAHGDEPQG